VYQRLVLLKIASVFFCTAIAWCSAARGQQETPASEAVTYDQVRPVFRKHCVTCHNQDRARGDLNLSSLEGIKAGSSSGAAVVANKPDESPIYLCSAHLEDPKMPPNSPKIPQRELDLIRRWIEGGLIERGTSLARLNTDAKPVAPAMVASPQSRPSLSQKLTVAVEPLARPIPITALAASPAAPLIAVPGHKQVVLFDQASQKPVKALAFPEGDVFALQFSRDGSLLLAGGGAGGASGKVVAFNVATGQRTFEVGEETDVVLALAISPNSKLVAIGGPSRSVKVFRAGDGELVTTLRKHTDWILSLAYSPDGLLLASSDRFGAVQVWEAQSGKEFHTLRGHTGPVHALGWSANSDQLLTGGEDGTVRLWNMHDGVQLSQWDGNVGPILAAGWDGNSLIICGGRDKWITIWDSAGKQLQQISMSDEVGKLAFTQDATQVVAGDAAGNIVAHRLQTGELVSRLKLPLGPSPASTRLAASSSAKAQTSTPAVATPTKVIRSSIPAEVIVAETEAKQAALDLANAREAAAAVGDSVKMAEQSLAKLRESASKLQAVVGSREAAAKLAAQRVTELRLRAEAGQLSAESDSSRLTKQQTLLAQRVAQTHSLHQATLKVADQIQAAAAQARDDAGLREAALLAKGLENKLATEVELAAQELRRVEVALRGLTQAENASAEANGEER
jgi:WD40 repeat protein